MTTADGEIKGTCAGQDPELGPLLTAKGEVSYVAAFPGTFVLHPDIEDARTNARKFCDPLQRTICIYRIEVVEVVEPAAPPRAAGGA